MKNVEAYSLDYCKEYEVEWGNFADLKFRKEIIKRNFVATKSGIRPKPCKKSGSLISN